MHSSVVVVPCPSGSYADHLLAIHNLAHGKWTGSSIANGADIVRRHMLCALELGREHFSDIVGIPLQRHNCARRGFSDLQKCLFADKVVIVVDKIIPLHIKRCDKRILRVTGGTADIMMVFPVLSRKFGTVKILQIGAIFGVVGYGLRILGGHNLGTLHRFLAQIRPTY